MIASLRAPLAHANSEPERKHRKQLQQQTRVKELRRVWFPLVTLFFSSSQNDIVNVALTEGRKQLHNGEPAMAFPPSLLALKLLSETHGPAHLELTPALLLLSQSAIGQWR